MQPGYLEVRNEAISYWQQHANVKVRRFRHDAMDAFFQTLPYASPGSILYRKYSAFLTLQVKRVHKSWDDNRDDACTKGTFMHNQIELYYNDEPHCEERPDFHHFIKFRDEYVLPRGLIPYRTEMIVHTWDDEDDCDYYKLCGSIDMIYQVDPATPKRIILFDWKRAKRLMEKHRETLGAPYLKMGKPPFLRVPDTSVGHYYIQLNTYKYILERWYGFVVISMHLGVFHPLQETYVVEDVPDLQKEIAVAFEARRKFLAKGGVDKPKH